MYFMEQLTHAGAKPANRQDVKQAKPRGQIPGAVTYLSSWRFYVCPRCFTCDGVAYQLVSVRVARYYSILLALAHQEMFNCQT